jgi:ankyrin repeat protein
MQSNLRIISSILSKDLGKRKFRKRINRIDKEGNTPLNLAVQNNHYFIVNYLLLNKANKNIKNKEGKDAFDVAKKNDNVKIMVLLRNF